MTEKSTGIFRLNTYGHHEIEDVGYKGWREKRVEREVEEGEERDGLETKREKGGGEGREV